MRRPKHRRRRNRNQGFSAPGQRQAWSWINRSSGLRGREKRQFFNQISSSMVASAGLVGAILGYSLLEWIGAVVGLVVAAGLMAKFVAGGGYFR